MLDVEPARLDRMLIGDGKVAETVDDDKFVKISDGGLCARQLANAVFGRDFPSACRTDEYDIGLICNGLGCAF